MTVEGVRRLDGVEGYVYPREEGKINIDRLLCYIRMYIYICYGREGVKGHRRGQERPMC